MITVSDIRSILSVLLVTCDYLVACALCDCKTSAQKRRWTCVFVWQFMCIGLYACVQCLSLSRLCLFVCVWGENEDCMKSSASRMEQATYVRGICREETGKRRTEHAGKVSCLYAFACVCGPSIFSIPGHFFCTTKRAQRWHHTICT